MSDETSLTLLKKSYNLAKEAKGEDRLTTRDLEEAKKVVKAKKKYEIAKEMKGEDRVTMADVKKAEKSIPDFSTGGDVVVGKGGDYIKDLL
jgi:hypothetical protein